MRIFVELSKHMFLCDRETQMRMLHAAMLLCRMIDSSQEAFASLRMSRCEVWSALAVASPVT